MTDPTATLPPQNLDAEESVLGSMLISRSAVEAVADLLSEGDFYRPSHGRVYRAAIDLYLNGDPVDAITVADRLEVYGQLAEVGGKTRIHELAALVPSAGNAAHYARIVHELALLRGLADAGDRISKSARERPKPTPELLDDAERAVFDLGRGRSSGEFVAVRDTLPDAFAKLRELHENPRDVTGVASGFRRLDHLTSGFQPGNLVIVAARPSIGKTAYALSVAANIAIRGELPVAFFTMEMSRGEITGRLLAAEALVESQKVRSGRLDRDEWQRLHQAGQALDRAEILVYDAGDVSLAEIRSRCRRLKLRRPDLALVVIDYLQLMTSGKSLESRVQEVSQISRTLKVLAGELQVPVMALSQLSRQVEGRHDKRPLLSDIRESGQIEADADVVLMLYRDDYYFPESAAEDGTAGIAEVNVAKQRNGPTGVVKLAFVNRYARFTDLASA